MVINKEVFNRIIQENNGKLIFKFTATWCGPCKRAAPFIQEQVSQLPEGVEYHEIDVDDSLDVYGMLKAKRIVTGVPSLVYYNAENKSYWPDEVLSSSDSNAIATFFNQVLRE